MYTANNYVNQVDLYYDSFDNSNLEWKYIYRLGKIEYTEIENYYIDISVREYNSKKYLVLEKHRPWKAQDRPFAIPINMSACIVKLITSICGWAKGEGRVNYKS